MGRLSKIKRELIEEANRRLLGEIQKDSTDLLYMSARGMTNLDFIVDYIWNLIHQLVTVWEKTAKLLRIT